ncbi:MAG: hypothetical protein WBM68_10570, partial [Woeseia sp.]
MIGAIFGGWLGVLVGAAAGYGAGIALKGYVIGSLQIAQEKLLDATFSIMGALCKADRVVSRDEIAAVERI